MPVSRRPLVFVLGLTLGDYLLWNWSLDGNHDVLALVAGLTLPPLAVASLWMLALGLLRMTAAFARRPAARRASSSPRRAASAPATAAGAESAAGTDPASGAASRKLAA